MGASPSSSTGKNWKTNPKQKSINTHKIKTFHSQSTHTKRIFADAGQRVKIQCHGNIRVPAMFLFHSGMKTNLQEHSSDLEVAQKLLFLY